MVQILKKYQGHKPYAHVLVQDVVAFKCNLRQRLNTNDCADLTLVSAFAAKQTNGVLTAEQLALANKVTSVALTKLKMCIDKHLSWNFFETTRIFDLYDVSSYGMPADVTQLISKTIPFAPASPDVVKLINVECVKYAGWVRNGGLPSNPLDFDVCSFWCHLSPLFPNFSKLALRVLAVPVTSADAERSFSTYNLLRTPEGQACPINLHVSTY
jgi:hypothetical protein